MQIQKDATLTGAIGNWSCRDDCENMAWMIPSFSTFISKKNVLKTYTQ